MSVTMPRLKNWRRVTPSASGSGGTYGSDGAPARDRSRAPPTRAALGGRLLDLATGQLGAAARAAWTARRGRARRVSRRERPVARSCRGVGPRRSRRRPRAARRSGSTMARTMAALIECLITARRRCPLVHGKTKLKPGPRKNEPMMTSTAQNIRNIVNSEIANLRSSGLLRRVLVDVRREDQQDRAHARDGHAGDHRVEHREQLLQAEEVPRRLRRVRRLVDVGQLRAAGR